MKVIGCDHILRKSTTKPWKKIFRQSFVLAGKTNKLPNSSPIFHLFIPLSIKQVQWVEEWKVPSSYSTLDLYRGEGDGAIGNKPASSAGGVKEKEQKLTGIPRTDFSPWLTSPLDMMTINKGN